MANKGEEYSSSDQEGGESSDSVEQISENEVDEAYDEELEEASEVNEEDERMKRRNDRYAAILPLSKPSVFDDDVVIQPKKLKGKSVLSSHGSQIFSPYRALGLVAGQVPFALHHHGAQSFLTVSIGSVVQVMNCKRLNLLFVMRSEKKVRALATSRLGFTFVCSGQVVEVWRRNKMIAVLRKHEHRIQHILAVGDNLLFTIDKAEVLCMWAVSRSEGVVLQSCFQLSSISDVNGEEQNDSVETPVPFHTTCLIHPDTYLNKILVGSEDGRMRLWNVRAEKLVYEFEGWGSPVVCIKQSPALDVVAVGLGDGRVVVHNLKYDKSVMCFQQVDGACTSIAFRTDGPSIMTTGSVCGNIAVWDLDKKRLLTVMKNVHPGHPILSMEFLPAQPVLVTAAGDNAIRMWIFDQSDMSGRLLRERSGHHAPPRRIRFYGEDDSHHILSAGDDRALRFFSTIQDHQNVELSQLNVKRRAKKYGLHEDEVKFPAITQFASKKVREREWDNIVTCHEDHPHAHMWNYERKVLGRHAFTLDETDKGSVPTSVLISNCGNFGILGSSTGTVTVYNVQSGILRGVFVDHSLDRAHGRAVTGLAMDNVGRWIVSSSLDKTIKIWNFRDRRLLSSINVGKAVNQLEQNQDGSLVAAVCDDLVIRLYNVEMQRIVRRFPGHKTKITDIAFSEDGRWLVSASTDKTVKVWDIPSSRLIDWFQVEKAVSSLAFSPTGSYLATAHVDDIGIYLWANRAFFSRVFLQPLSLEKPVGTVALPLVQVAEGTGEEEHESEEEGSDVDLDEKERRKQAKEAREWEEKKLKKSNVVTFSESDTLLVTLSGLSSNHWKDLPMLDLIRQRNKPTEPTKPKESAPFFLDMKLGKTQNTILSSTDAAAPVKTGGSRILNFGKMKPKTHFMGLLQEGIEKEGEGKWADYKAAMSYLAEQGPAAIELEFQMLNTEEEEELAQVIDFFYVALDRNWEYDLVQAWLCLFLKLQSQEITQHKNLALPLERLEKKQSESWIRLESMNHNAIYLINMFLGLNV